LTQIYLDIARPSTDSHAKGVVFATSLFTDEAERQGKDCSAPIEEVREIIKSILKTQYGATVTYTVESHANVHCEDGANPFTISTLIANISIGFERMKAHKWRKGKNPLTIFHPVTSEMIKYREGVMDTSELKFTRSPTYFFQVKGKKLKPIFVTDGDVLPNLMRGAGIAVKWWKREHAILNILIDGPRCVEVVEMTVGGWHACNFGNEVMLHNKGQGRVATKKAPLSKIAQDSLREYFMEERCNHDKRRKHFSAWAAGKAGAHYSPEWYAKYMIEHSIDMASEPFFLTDDGRPYISKTFCRQAWKKARDQAGITATPHHLRRRYVNAEIKTIEEQFGDDPAGHYRALMKFIRRMGWRRWKSMAAYDFEGSATAFLKFYIATQLDEEDQDEHETAAELMQQLNLLTPVKETG
jgi:hypothetical protein